MTERIGWEPESESPHADIDRAIDERWNSPFEGQIEGNPVLAAAEAVWAVHKVASWQHESEIKSGRNNPSHPDYGLDDAYDDLIAKKDELLGRLTDTEQQEALLHASRAIGYVEDTESPIDLEGMLGDLETEVQRVTEGNIREIGGE